MPLTLVSSRIARDTSGGEKWVRVVTCCSCRGPRFSLQHLPGSSQLSVSSVPGDLMPSSGLYRHQTCMQCTNIYASTKIHKKAGKMVQCVKGLAAKPENLIFIPKSTW